MKSSLPDHQLKLLQQQPPTIPLQTVKDWMTTGRPQPRFHPLAWLSRVGWRWPN